MEPSIKFNKVSKFFGNIIALKHISFTVYKGEITALLGDNGSGKSTLIKLLSGVYSPDEGEILLDGKPVKFKSPRDAVSSGIGTVYQDLALQPLMSVTRNFFLGREISKGLSLDFQTMDNITKTEMAKLGIDVADPSQPIGTMSGGQRQTLAISRAIYFGAKVLILDEPTSGLDPFHQRTLFEIVKEFANDGAAILLSSHIISEVEKVADSMAVLREGAKVYDETYETFLNKAKENIETKKMIKK